jgi:peptide/nickel transport system permease protein
MRPRGQSAPVFWYLVKRTAGVVLSLLVASLLLYLTLNILPGKASTAALGLNPTPEAVAAFNARYGLDRPLVMQYFSWLGGVIQGDFGRSYQTEISIGAEVARRVPVTLELTFLATLAALAVAIPLAVVASLWRGGVTDLLATSLSLIGLSLPAFALATAMVLVFALRLHWLPPGGYVSPLVDLGRNLRLMILPAVSLGLVSGGLLMRIFRAGLTDALARDYILASRSRGASKLRVLARHAVRVAIVPFITVGAMEVGAIFGGAVVVEKIFQIPGIGGLVLQGIEARDFHVLQAAALVIAAFVMIANLAVDMVAAAIDPRLRVDSSR